MIPHNPDGNKPWLIRVSEKLRAYAEELVEWVKLLADLVRAVLILGG